MRGEKSWVAGIHETTKMSSIIGLPTQYSDVTVLISSLHLHPLCVLVEFWGKFSEEKTADYECLAKEIQSPGNTFQEFEGNPGDQCLAQVDGSWYRSRIVSKNGSKYSVFLFDKGRTHSTTTSQLAWGKKNHFYLPPEVEFCVLANVLPLSPEKRWSPAALEFLKSLSGKFVKAHVQDVLVAHRTFLLHIPCISKQMYEMGIARKLSPNVFQDFVLLSLQTHSGVQVSPETRISMAGERLHKNELFMYPELSAGTVETVIVTEVTNPQRIFCQLKVFSQELKKLSGKMTQCCEGRTTNCIVSPEMIGFPCAAKGSDGRWYRSVLQQVCSNNKVVEVLNVDYGTKQFVQTENVRPLTSEFFRMPVVTYICSFHGIIDKGVGWTTSQIDYLRTLLLYKTVIAKFEYQSVSEGVHYVTLYGDDNTSINNLFGSKESCFLESEKTLGDYAIRNTGSSCKHPAQQERNLGKMLTHGQTVEGKEDQGIVRLTAEELALNSSHLAAVQHISDPSEFWIQTQCYANELDKLMDSINHLYKDSDNIDVVINPTVGLYCAAKAEDGEFYRATVEEGSETQVKVFFVDYGNTEVVNRSNIRTLPDEFKKLPCLSLKCSLADVRPKDGKWSRSACDFFIKAVKDKDLTVHVMAKYGESYVVQLTDTEAQGERDLSTQMCSSGHAERAETQRQLKTKITTQSAILPQLPDARLSGAYSNKGMPFQTTVNTVVGKEKQIPTFKEHMFPIGSVIDVSVSYIESPNDFWCQQVKNTGHLKLLMHDIQAQYAGSEFQPNVEMACIARHPDNQLWYRALVIYKRESPHVDVLFVDYGQTETVSLYDLRRISPQFLALQGQAFRCSLLNPVDPMSAVNEWNEEAIAKFHSFVETASSNVPILKCTIYAVMYSEQKIVFNIVDLETPFESVCTSMVNLVKSAPPKKAAGPAFRLDTYYYSTHNVKTGTEEQVTVTCVNNVHEFYCHLEKKADVIKDLKIKVGNLCHQLRNVKLPTVFGTLCFAKYTDGHWYRGQIKATKPAILVHFVDYGETIEVEKSDLLPVPREASDIMSVPVQAVLCSLSDVPANVPTEMNSWFETSATDCKFRALVVAREPDGKLQVELYHGNTQVNSKIKKMFQTENHKKENVVHQSQRALEASANNLQKTAKVVPEHAAEMQNAVMNLQSASKPFDYVCETGRKIRAVPFEFYIPPHKRHACRRTPNSTGNGFEPAGAHIKPRKESLPTEAKQLESKSLGTEFQKKTVVEKVPELADLPSNSITSDMEADVYVSHCNNPLSFYVQLVREEDDIFSLVEKLNDPQSTPQTNIAKDVHPGDLVQAEFADDSSWYRAVVREMHGKTMALVEFVDFGNTAIVPISKICILQKSFLQLPSYSTHCMMNEASGLGKEDVLDPEVVSAFKEDIGSNGEKVLKCHFVRQSGSVWKVTLKDNGVNVMCKVPPTCSTDDSEIASEEPEQVKEQSTQIWQNVPDNSEKSPLNSSLCYHQEEFLEGQKLEVYITAICDAQTFWCHPADSEDLEKITSSVSKVLDADSASHKDIDPDSISPGSPCIALFSDDGFWYRAEVIDRDEDGLSVLFVDYGNKTQVNFTDLREMPPDLTETPRQAFLCELEGFDASHGSWHSSAVDELSALTTDKVLQLTVSRVTREAGKMKCIVRMECKGQVINEALKTWWKSATTENQPGAFGLTPPCQTQLQFEEQSTGELGDPHADIMPCDGGMDETRLPKLHNKGAQDILTFSCDKSAVETVKRVEKEASLVLDIIGPDDFNSPLDENPTDTIDELEVTMASLKSLPGEVPTYSVESIFDITYSSDLTEDKDDSKVIMSMDNSLTSTTTVKMVSHKAFWPKDSVDLLETHVHISEGLKQIQAEVVLPYCVLPAFDVPTDKEIDIGDGVPNEELACVTAHVENDWMTAEDNMTHHKDVYSVLPVDLDTAAIEKKICTTPLQDSVEEATCSVEEATCSVEEATCSFEEETCSVEEATCSEDEATCSFEEATCSEDEATCSFEEAPCSVEEAPFSFEDATCSVEDAPCSVEDAPCSVEEAACSFEDATCSFEEAPCLTDVFTDPDEPSDDWKITIARDDRLSSTSAEVQHDLLRSCRELQQQLPEASSELEIGDISLQDEAKHNTNKDEASALPSGIEPQEYAVRSPDLSDLIEEGTCLVRENCRTDVCRGLHQEYAREEIEQLALTPSSPREDFSDGVLEEDICSSAGDSFEDQLSRLTHLSLIVNDGSAEVLLVKQQPE